MRGEGKGDCGAGVIFRNINIEDQRPTLQQFFINMTIPKPYSNDAETRGKGNCANIIFENITIAAPSVVSEPQILWGAENARIQNLVFKNLTVGGKAITDANFFKTNAFVENLVFEPNSKGAK